MRLTLLPGTSRCFIQYRDNENKTLLRNWDLMIIFQGNEAKGEGKVTLFMPHLYICAESLIIIMETEP